MGGTWGLQHGAVVGRQRVKRGNELGESGHQTHQNYNSRSGGAQGTVPGKANRNIEPALGARGGQKCHRIDASVYHAHIRSNSSIRSSRKSRYPKNGLNDWNVWNGFLSLIPHARIQPGVDEVGDEIDENKKKR